MGSARAIRTCARARGRADPISAQTRCGAAGAEAMVSWVTETTPGSRSSGRSTVLPVTARESTRAVTKAITAQEGGQGTVPGSRYRPGGRGRGAFGGGIGERRCVDVGQGPERPAGPPGLARQVGAFAGRPRTCCCVTLCAGGRWRPSHGGRDCRRVVACVGLRFTRPAGPRGGRGLLPSPSPRVHGGAGQLSRRHSSLRLCAHPGGNRERHPLGVGERGQRQAGTW